MAVSVVEFGAHEHTEPRIRSVKAINRNPLIRWIGPIRNPIHWLSACNRRGTATAAATHHVADDDP